MRRHTALVLLAGSILPIGACSGGSSADAGRASGGADSGTTGGVGAHATGGVGAHATGGIGGGATGGDAGSATGGIAGSATGGIAGSEIGGGAGGAIGGAGGGIGGNLSCPATGTAYCTNIGGWDARCYPDGHASYCPNNLPKCWELTDGQLECVLADSKPCDPATYQSHCEGDSIVTCQKLFDGQGATWPADCSSASQCLDLDTGKFNVPGPCKCSALGGPTPSFACVPPSVQSCDAATWPRSCVGNTLRFCKLGLTAEHDCGSDMICQSSNGSAGCAAPGLTPCSNELLPCFNTTVAQVCCDPSNDVTCLPGYLTLQDCVSTFGPSATCDSFWGYCKI